LPSQKDTDTMTVTQATTGDGGIALIGRNVRIRRYVQPTLKDGDPDRELRGETAGTVTRIDRRGRLVLDSDPDPVWPGYQFLGGDPQLATCRYLVTEITASDSGPGVTAGQQCLRSGDQERAGSDHA
jgi:hypothetical protein